MGVGVVSLDVAPRAGAWVETYPRSFTALIASASHPVRVRGLKRSDKQDCSKTIMSHPVRVRGLKHHIPAEQCSHPVSHPVRVRGLKLGD